MTKFLTLALLAVALISCGQRVAPAGPDEKVQDSTSY